MQTNCWKLAEKTHGERNWPDVGSEVLLDGPSGAELVAGRDHPEAHRWVAADPSVHPVVLVLA